MWRFCIGCWAISPIFAQILMIMEQQKKYKGLYWLLFFISAACFITAIYLHFSYLTFILPFVGTFFVKAMDII
jgi:uncharacterized membrane protein